MNKQLHILIATGIYPPALGGPAKYAENVKKEWEKKGHEVKVKTFDLELSLPSGLRHLYYFFKIIPAVIRSDFIFALDTFSVGFPATVAAKIFGKKIIIRTGGDFLWEGYVERTGDLVLFRNFYDTTRYNWSIKEKIIFKITKWVLHNVDLLVMSTSWQKNIWMKPYDQASVRTAIIENYYGIKEESFEPTRKDFIGGARPLKWKNMAVLEKVFSEKEIADALATYHNETCPHEEFMDKIAHAYAILLASLGDISPNMILDSIRHNKPFILTEENGLMDRIGSIAITVNPKDLEDIKQKILWLCKKENYDAQVQKIRSFNFTHSWEEIGVEILALHKTLI